MHKSQAQMPGASIRLGLVNSLYGKPASAAQFGSQKSLTQLELAARKPKNPNQRRQQKTANRSSAPIIHQPRERSRGAARHQTTTSTTVSGRPQTGNLVIVPSASQDTI